MNKVKKLISIIIVFIMLFCISGCGVNNGGFSPVGVKVVESIGGTHYETLIDDEETAKKMWKTFDSLIIDTEEKGEMGSSYLYMCFYDENQTSLGIFTIYENGTCCLGEDFENFYTVSDGKSIYSELCDIYTSYEKD